MNKQDFLKQLECLLQNIPEQERVEALQYYNDYFEDAGEENEQAVMEALGNPARVAENIKKDLYQNRYNYGVEQEKVTAGKEIVKYQPETAKVQTSQEAPKKEGLSTGVIVLIVILCVLASPILLGILSGLFGFIGGILITWLTLIICFGAVAIALLAVGIALAVVGVIGMVSNPLAGLGIVGGGLLVTAVGLSFLMLVVFMAGWATPAAVKGIIWVVRKLTGKNKAA